MRGLSCGVSEVEPTAKAEAPQTTSTLFQRCTADLSGCSQVDLCKTATYMSNSKELTWLGDTNNRVKEAKKRGLSCGVKTVVEKKCSTKTPEVCTTSNVCSRATNYTSSSKIWSKAYDQGYVKEAKKRGLTCGVGAKTTVRKLSPVTNSTTDNSAELRQLRQERELLEANLLATQQLMEQQKRAAERPYKACRANCLLNNKAGKGFAALMSGLAQCNSSCAPLKWGGTVVPPTWDRDVKQLKRYDCMITKLNRNQASVDCNQF